MPGQAATILVTTIVLVAAVLFAMWGCAERSRLARCACAAVLVAIVGYLGVRWLHPPHAVRVFGAYGAVAVALEWRRKVPGQER